MAGFVHLHNHSEFSLLDGLQKIKKMAQKAKDLGAPAVAITDHGSMYGAIKFYQACKALEIKPIIGCEIYVAKRSLHDKEAGIDKEYNHLILLAENNIGYKNLMKIVSVSYLEGYYYKPRTDLELLRKYHEGLICLSACVNGYVTEPLVNEDIALGEQRAMALSEIFGPDNFFLEIQRHIHVPPQEDANQKLIAMSKKLGLPLVATNDNHYTNKGDAEGQEVLLCIQTQSTLLDKNRKLSMVDSPDFYQKSEEEMRALFPDAPEAIDNTVKIAERCNVEIELGKWVMPNFEVPGGLTTKDYLRKLVYDGATKRYDQLAGYDFSNEPQGDYENGADNPQDVANPTAAQIVRRLNYELSVIEKKGYETYFLVVSDFVNWAKDHGIAVGPGRGSAAGSAVGYCLRITDVDPFYFKLPFERFLNPLRPSAPDIDLDFADTRREEVIAYVTQKYGVDKVAQIITFGTMEAKAAIRDVGRVMGYPYNIPDRISKMVPPGFQGHSMSLDNAIEQNPELKAAYHNEPDTKKIIDLAKKLESVTRHASIHAAGVVIANKPLTEYVPLQRETNGEKIVTQYDMYTVGEDGVGLLKMDFLGLRNLTIIEEALKFIKQNQNADIDWKYIPLDDPQTYQLLSQGETTGIFQLESAGMRRYIKELRPTTIFDLQAMVALYRPGPMQNIPEFVKRKNNPEFIHYPHEKLKDILKESYGVLTFQDDVLLTAITLAGYSWLDVDKFRKAMGKKIPAEMKKQEEMFIAGCMKNGLSEQKTREIYDLIAPFAGYGFNKAHAACYAMIAFRTAYLKAHYPVEFMTALLTAESRGTTGPQKNEKIAMAIAECKRLNVPVLPPHINKSQSDFSIEDKTKVRFGLSAVKNVGGAAIESILEARSRRPFSDLYDLCTRVDLSKVNKKTLESLIKAGGFDHFGNRASLLISMPEIMMKAQQQKKQASEGQSSLFGEDDESIGGGTVQTVEVEDFSKQEKLMFEKEFLGFYLTSHPHADSLMYIKKVIDHEIEFLPEEKEGTIVRVGGIIETFRKILTKKTQAEMAFISIANEKGLTVESVIFPRVFEQYKPLLTSDNCIVIEGKLDVKDEQPVIIAERIYAAKELMTQNITTLPTYEPQKFRFHRPNA